MHKSKDEYLMLREEIIHLSEMENNIFNFFYIFVATIIAFSLTQKDTIFILLAYIAIIPSYRLVLSKETGVYKIGAYLYVFHEGKDFNWERRSEKFYDILFNGKRKMLQAFNVPYLFVSSFITIIFILRTDWRQLDEIYELLKVISALILYIVIIRWINEHSHMSINRYIPYWMKVKECEKSNKH